MPGQLVSSRAKENAKQLFLTERKGVQEDRLSELSLSLHHSQSRSLGPPATRGIAPTAARARRPGMETGFRAPLIVHANHSTQKWGIKRAKPKFGG